MEKRIKEKVLSQLSLIEQKRLLNTERLTGNKSQIWGNAERIIGNVSGIWGDVTGICGNVSGIWGNASGVWGDFSRIKGDVTGIKGNASEIIEVLKTDSLNKKRGNDVKPHLKEVLGKTIISSKICDRGGKNG